MAIITFTDADGIEQTLDTSKPFNVAYHADCRVLLKALPDKVFNLCCTDPPYGDGNADNEDEHRNQRGRFDRYNDSSQTVNVEREREREREAPRSTTASEIQVPGLSGTRVSRTGGTWAEKYGKKS